MSKELEALNDLYKLREEILEEKVCHKDSEWQENIKIYDRWGDDLTHIETALKRLEELTQKHNELLYNYAELVNCGMKSEQKKLKALETIKQVIPIDKEDFFYDKETDTYFFWGYKVSKEQFNLLKEVLL